MRSIVLLLAPLLVLAGCVTPAATEDAPLEGAATPAVDLAPLVQEIEGRMLASAAAPLAHQNPDLEMMVAPIQREGFLLEIAEVPTMLQIELEWSSPSPAAEMFAMVNVPTGVDGEVVDYFTDVSGSGKVCMRLPVGELIPDTISLMAHSSSAVDVSYTIRVTTIGGATTLLDKPHMEVERADAKEGKALPCEEEAADA